MIKGIKLITNPKVKSPVAEAYKTLRTNIQFSSLDKKIRIILITSSNASEGKSTTAANLAITMAQSDKRVLLVDCDLRKPTIHKAFGFSNEKGITNALAEGLDFHDICASTGIANLHVLTSGPKPPNPTELLGSARMEALIKAISEEYDIIIIDSPPVLPVTDAAVLSRLADGVIMVLTYGETSRDTAMQAKETLDKVDANIIGTVINNMPTKGRKAYHYYYYYEEGASSKKKSRHRERAVNI